MCATRGIIVYVMENKSTSDTPSVEGFRSPLVHTISEDNDPDPRLGICPPTTRVDFGLRSRRIEIKYFSLTFRLLVV